MKNVKLTLATTLSVLAITFSGTASADGFNGQYKFKQNAHKQHAQKHKNVIVKSSRTQYQNRGVASNKKVVKRVVVKNTPKTKVVITKTIIKKPNKTKRFVQNNRANKYKNYNKRFAYNNRFKNKRAVRQYVYSVRPGDTLIQVAFKTGVSVRQLARLNRINYANLNNLRIGQVLRLI